METSILRKITNTKNKFVDSFSKGNAKMENYVFEFTKSHNHSHSYNITNHKSQFNWTPNNITVYPNPKMSNVQNQQSQKKQKNS